VRRTIEKDVFSVLKEGKGKRRKEERGSERETGVEYKGAREERKRGRKGKATRRVERSVKKPR